MLDKTSKKKENNGYLAGEMRCLGKLERGFETMREEVSFDVEYIRTVDQGRDVGRRQVRLFKLLSHAQAGDQRPMLWRSVALCKVVVRRYTPVVSSDDDSASASLLPLLHEVGFVEPFALVGGL